MQCTTTRGAGARVSWVVTIAQLSSSSPSTSFAPPSITSVTRPAGASISLFATRGGDAVLIAGVNLAPAAEFVSWLVTVTLSGVGVPTVPLLNCTVPVDYVQVLCLMPPGRGTGFTIRISVENQLSAPSTDVISFAPPLIAGIAATPSTPLTADGGSRLVMSGVNFGVGALFVYACAASTSVTAADLAASGGCVELPPAVPTSDGAPISVSSPAMGVALAGAPRVSFYVVSAGQASLPVSLTVASLAVTQVSAMAYSALAAATNLDSSTAECYVLIQAKTAPSQWSVLQIVGQNLGIAAAIAVPVVSIAPSNGAASVACSVCSLSSIIALCVSNTSSSATRNGMLTYTLGSFSVSTNVLLDVALPPRLLSLARDGRAGVVAVPGGLSSTAGLGVGDTLVLRFDTAVTAVAVATKAAVDALLIFSAPIGTSYTGAWVSSNELQVVVTAAPASPAVGTGVGQLIVNISATANLKAATGTSPPSTSSGALEAGSWGDAVRGVAVVVRSSTQLYVTVTAPNLATYPSTLTSYSIDSYVVSWGTTAAATGLGSQAVNFTQLLPAAATTSVTLSSLRTNTPVYVRVALILKVAAGLERLACVGPFSFAASSVAPAVPRVTLVAVAGGHSLTTRGGDVVSLYGKSIGLFDSDVNASYSNGNFTFSATSCAVVVPGVQVACTSAVGVGFGYVWRIAVVSATSAPSPTQYATAYGLPIITDYSGPGAFDAVTQGGQHVVVTGDMFGPVGSAFITAVE